MDIGTINKKEITICSASDVESSLLNDFYKKAYPERINSLKLHWKWLNRTDFNENITPLVLVYQNQVIAHSGIIPFHMSLNDGMYTASWYIDFKILPEFQRQGLGSILINEWIKQSDYCLATGCTVGSYGAFNKYGWIQSVDTYLHNNFLRPFNHPAFVSRLPVILRKILNSITYPIFFLINSRHSYSNNFYLLEKLTEKSFNDFFNFYSKNKKILKNIVSPIRDMDYAKWRVLNSPNVDKYFIYKTDNFSSLVSLQNNNGEYIDILWVSDSSDKIEINKMISTLGIYGLKNGFSYIRFYTTNKEVSDYIKKKTKSLVRYPLFVYFSKNESVLEKLKKANWDLELIDNDFEHLK